MFPSARCCIIFFTYLVVFLPVKTPRLLTWFVNAADNTYCRSPWITLHSFNALRFLILKHGKSPFNLLENNSLLCPSVHMPGSDSGLFWFVCLLLPAVSVQRTPDSQFKNFKRNIHSLPPGVTELKTFFNLFVLNIVKVVENSRKIIPDKTSMMPLQLFTDFGPITRRGSLLSAGLGLLEVCQLMFESIQNHQRLKRI